MDVFPKFIIEKTDEHGNCLIIAKCTYHRQLAYDVNNVISGGWWTLDHDNLLFTLSGDSTDFGRATIKDIVDCIKRKKVFSSYSLTRNFTDKYKFQYKNQVGDIINLENFNDEEEY